MAGETKQVQLTWEGGLTFRGGAPGGPTVLVDADNAAAPGPMLQLLLAVGSCSGADVVSILTKMRAGLERLRIEVSGERREEHPRRYLRLHYVFHVEGAGLERAKVQRAIDLSLATYCSVLHSLNPDIAVTHELRLA
ncbi:MAG: OsmC family protein [Gemmatimonadales bacterium]|jgi:putative redox protein|nr:OsmC family protein [Gemmatimonadales bacterium]